MNPQHLPVRESLKRHGGFRQRRLVPQIPGRASAIRRTWSWWRRTMTSRSLLCPVPTASGANAAMRRYRIRCMDYQGRSTFSLVNTHGRIFGPHRTRRTAQHRNRRPRRLNQHHPARALGPATPGDSCSTGQNDHAATSSTLHGPRVLWVKAAPPTLYGSSFPGQTLLSAVYPVSEVSQCCPPLSRGPAASHDTTARHRGAVPIMCGLTTPLCR